MPSGGLGGQVTGGAIYAPELWAEPLTEFFRTASEPCKRFFICFLSQIQAAHDEAGDPTEMRRTFESIRLENGWPIPSEVF
jgi:hypothetical protein